MLEGGQTKTEGDVEVAGGMSFGIRFSVVGNLPLVFHLFQAVPCAAVFLAGFAETRAGNKVDMGAAGPFLLAHRWLPESLGLRTTENIPAVALKFFAVSAVKKFVVFPHHF